jgi:hypothetical protein
MTDEPKGRLGRLGDRVLERRDTIGGSRAARDRRTRRRRRGVLTVVVVVALVGVFVVSGSLRGDGTGSVPGDDDRTGEAWELPTTPYLWPENWARAEDRAALADLQAAADAGDPEIAWRLDPEQVVDRFLETVLAWEEPQVEVTDALADGTVFVAAPRCEGNAVDCDRGTLLVVVDQPSRRGEGGVWSVVSVSNDALQVRGPLGLAPALLAGSQIGFELTLPEGRAAHAGLVASNGCREVSEFALTLESGSSTLRVPEAEADDPSCGPVGAGSLFVYATDGTTVPTGDPLLEAATIEYPWLTIMPVEVHMSSAGQATD